MSNGYVGVACTIARCAPNTAAHKSQTLTEQLERQIPPGSGERSSKPDGEFSFAVPPPEASRCQSLAQGSDCLEDLRLAGSCLLRYVGGGPPPRIRRMAWAVHKGF